MNHKQFMVDKLKVSISNDVITMGRMAAKTFSQAVQSLLLIKPEITVMFAAAPSQDSTLQALLQESSIPWERIHAVHMDEYVGLSYEDHRSFRHYLQERILKQLPFKSINLITGENPDAQDEAKRYSQILLSLGIDIVVLGVGENGHIAFNDPPDARFDDPSWVRVVQLSEASRKQQVHDGCFDVLEKVPRHAITVTIPAILSAQKLICVVPGSRKAKAIQTALEGPINEGCPASILRTHKDSSLFIDSSSAALLRKGFGD
jgi:glucosamine-6-phosphate deaminase